MTLPVPKRQLVLMTGLGFASGLPLYLTYFTLQQWLSELGLSLKAIGTVALFGLPYLLKFLWAPLLDRLPPGVLRRLGRRRGWLLPIQLLLTLSIVRISTLHPEAGLWPLAATAFVLAFLAASQDIAIDAWRIETFAPEHQAVALGGYSWGYRTAMLCSGAGAIGLAAAIGWRGALLGMALLSLLGPVLTLLAPEPPPPEAAGAAVPPSGWRASLNGQIVAPFRDLLSRPAAPLLILFVLVFNLGTQLADGMAYPLYHRLGYAPAAVAAANGIPSLAAALAGAAASGLAVARLGIGRGLIAAACLQMASILLYLAVVHGGGASSALYAKVVLEGFAETLAQTTLAAYLSRLCSREYTATQYALLSSLAPVAWRTLGGTSGILAQALGWNGFFWLCAAFCLPGIGIMLLLMRRFPSGLPPARPA